MRTTNITYAILIAATFGSVLPKAKACSCVFLNNDSQQMIVGRTFDLYIDDKPRLVFYPRGAERSGAEGANNAVHWVSKYASIGVLSLEEGNSDGLNEKGLAAHLLYLDGTKYEPTDERPIIASPATWAQYVLDTCATVPDALAALAKVRVAEIKAAGRDWPLHLAMEDASGDSAIIEYVNGKMVVLHGKEYTVMTNEPSMDVQLANRSKYKLFGGSLAMPGDIDPASRFVRASSYLKTMAKPANADEAALYVLGVMRTTMVPQGAEDTGHSGAADTWPTRWTTISDLHNRRMYFQSAGSPNIPWVDLEKLAASTEMLSVLAGPSLHGEISGQFTKFTPKQKD